MGPNAVWTNAIKSQTNTHVPFYSLYETLSSFTTHVSAVVGGVRDLSPFTLLHRRKQPKIDVEDVDRKKNVYPPTHAVADRDCVYPMFIIVSYTYTSKR